MTWTLRIPLASPSLNAFAFAHWRVQHTTKKMWADVIRGTHGFLEIPKATGKRRLTIERHGKQPMDLDNLIGGAKGCITDNLRDLGLLVDDRPEMIEFHAVNVPLEKGEKPHTILIIEEVSHA